MLQILGVRSRADELLILTALLLAAGLAQFACSVDLIVQIHLYEIFLLGRCVETLLNLIECFFRPKVRLIVHCLHFLLGSLAQFLFCDLILEELTVGRVLVHPILSLQVLDAVHVVYGGVELILLMLSYLLNVLRRLIISSESLLIHAANRFIRVSALVLSMVIDSERPIGQHEFGHSGVVLVRDLLAIEGTFNITDLLEHLGGDNMRACL